MIHTPTSPQKQQHATLQALLHAFNAREEDLIANRDGRISERQRTWLAPPKFNGIVLTVVLGHMMLIGGILGAIAIMTGELFLFFVLLMVLGLGALPFMLIGREGIGRPVLQNDVKRGTVTLAQGMLLREPVSKPGHYYVHVGEKRFKVSARVYEHLIDKADYRFYYLPDSHMLLSAEPVTHE